VSRDERGRFPPGVSGNPGGQRKGLVGVTRACRHLMLYGRDADPIPGTEGQEAWKLARKLIERAERNDFALSVLWNRLEGKVPEVVFTGDEPEKLFRRVLYVEPDEPKLLPPGANGTA